MTATTPETTVETLPYKNPDLPASERIADLLSRMTLEEKVGQIVCVQLVVAGLVTMIFRV